MKKISLFGVFCLFFFLAKQVIAIDHLTSSHKPSALSSQERAAEVFQLPANIEPSMLIAQTDTSPQDADQAEFERRQQRIKELEVAIQKRMDTAQPKQAITEKAVAEKLSSDDTKSGLWKTLAIFAVVLLGLLTLLRIWWQNKQERELEEQAIWETLEAADPDVSASPTADSLASDNTNTKHGADSSILAETESDPIAAAAIFLAFEQRERAIKVLKDALINDPAQADITAKLLTLYANDGNIRAFTSLFESAADNIENEEQWHKIKLLAEATIPEHKIHAYDSNASVPILQDAIQDEELENSQTDELDAIHTSEEESPEVIVDESTTTAAQSHISQSNLPAADTSKQPESRPQNKTTELSKNDLKTTLALAKAYLDIGNDEAAIGFIIDVTNNDQGQLGQEAQLLLDSLDKDLLDRTIAKQLSIKENQVPLADLRSISKREDALEHVEESAGEPDLDSPPTEAEADDFDLILDEELKEVNIHNPETALTLAKAYIDLGEDKLARDFLIDADATDNSEDKAEIKRLLAELDQKTSDETQEPMEVPTSIETPSNEDLRTEENIQAEQDAQQEVEPIAETKLEDPNNEPVIEQASLAETNPDDEAQHEAELQQSDSDTDTAATVTETAKPKHTEQEASSLLALAKSYIALEEYDLARKFLKQANQAGHQAQAAEALQILSVLDAGGNLDFIFNFEMPPASARDETIPAPDEALDQQEHDENRPVAGDVSGEQSMPMHDASTNDSLAGDTTEPEIERTENKELNEPEDGSSMDGEEKLDDQISIAESAASVDGSDLEDPTLHDDLEFSHVDAKRKQADESETNDGRIDALYEADQDSEIVDPEPRDRESALELAKAYIEVGEEETAREGLEDEAKPEIERTDGEELSKAEDGSWLDSADKLDDQISISDSVATVDDGELNDLVVQDDPEFSHVNVTHKQADEFKTHEDLTDALYDIDQESEIVELEPHDPETALELAKAYIELGDEKTAIEVLEYVTRSDKEKCVLKARSILASLGAAPEALTIADKQAQTPAANKNINLPTKDNTSRQSEAVSGVDTRAVSSEPSSTPTKGDDDSTILIETEQYDPETAIELAYAYIELGEKKIAKNILQEIINMGSNQKIIRAKAIAALNSLS